MDWNTAKDKMWNGISWYMYGLIGPTTSTTDISLVLCQKSQICPITVIFVLLVYFHARIL